MAKQELKDRIKLIIDREKLTPSAFAEKTGISQATISHILNGRNKTLSAEILIKIHETYNVSLDWLILGEETHIIQEPNNSPSNGELPFEENYPPLIEQPNNLQAEQQQGAAMQTKIIYKESPRKVITEIRVFFDDNTFEIFVPKG